MAQRNGSRGTSGNGRARRGGATSRSGGAGGTLDPGVLDGLEFRCIGPHRGGRGSGIFRSTDGGDTWTDLTDRPGLPRGVKGRIGIAVSPARSGRVYAVVEAVDGAVFRSDDGGESWQ